MLRSNIASMSEGDTHHDCRSCGTSIPSSEPILVKFQRCYYCGQHHPFGNIWMNRTAPAIIMAAIGLIALWWVQLAS
jgi:hypothetical protein